MTYMSRFLRSDAYQKNSERNRIVMSEFGTLAMPDPCKNFFQRFLSRFEMIRKYIVTTLLHFNLSQKTENIVESKSHLLVWTHEGRKQKYLPCFDTTASCREKQCRSLPKLQ